MKKQKILFVGYEEYLKKTMLTSKLKALSLKFEIIFVDFSESALYEIAKANWQEKNPIRGLVFQRDKLVTNGSRYKLVRDFAEKCSKKEIVAINMVWNDQDVEARNASVSADYCKVDDWERVEVLFEKLLT